MAEPNALLQGFISPCPAQFKEFLSDSTVTTNQKNDSSSSQSLLQEEAGGKAALFSKEVSQEEVNKSEEKINGMIKDVLEQVAIAKDNTNEEGSSENMVANHHISERICFDRINNSKNNGDDDEEEEEDGDDDHGEQQQQQQQQQLPWKLELSTNPSCFQPKASQGSSENNNHTCDEKLEATASYRQGNWLLNEILILLEAKAKEEEESMAGESSSSSRRSRPCADDKWKNVSEYCRAKGVYRTKEQCRIKWDNMMPDFRKIRDYEEAREASAQSYFDMEAWERRAKILPSNMDMVVYQKVASILSSKPCRERGGGGGSLSGLKREAREKKMMVAMAMVPLSPAGQEDRGGGGGSAMEQQKQQSVADLVGKHIAAASSSRKRRRRRASVMQPPSLELADMSVREAKAMRMELMVSTTPAKEPPPPTDDCMHDSSTEDDDTMMMMMMPGQGQGQALGLGQGQGHGHGLGQGLGLGQQGQRGNIHAGSSYLFAERSNLPAAHGNGAMAMAGNLPTPRLLRLEAGLLEQHAGNGSSPCFESTRTRPPAPPAPAPAEIDHHHDHDHHSQPPSRIEMMIGGPGDGSHLRRSSSSPSSHHHQHHHHQQQQQQLLGLIEDRKEARHRELMALEREKLTVFKEASFTIANTMANAMTMFSKVAEELLLRRRPR